MFHVKQYINILLNENLKEDKFNDLLKSYDYLAPQIEILKKNNVNPKYALWIVNQLKIILDSEGHENMSAMVIPIIEWVERFDDLIKSKKISGKESDINTYKNWYEFKEFIVESEQKITSTEMRRSAKKDAVKIYEDDTFLVVQPISTAASCYYGKGTKWCISATKGDNPFIQYTQGQDKEILFILNKQTKDKDAIVFERGTDEVEVYDIEDNDKNISYLIKKYINNKDLINAINKHAEQEIISSWSIQKALDNPEEFLKNYKFMTYIFSSNSFSEEEKFNVLKAIFNKDSLSNSEYIKNLLYVLEQFVPASIPLYNLFKDFRSNIYVNYFLNKMAIDLIFKSSLYPYKKSFIRYFVLEKDRENIEYVIRKKLAENVNIREIAKILLEYSGIVNKEFISVYDINDMVELTKKFIESNYNLENLIPEIEKQQQLQESIKFLCQNIILEVLEENKFDDAIKSNPKFKDELEYFKSGHINSGYIPWIIKMFNTRDQYGYFSIKSGGRENLDVLIKNLKDFFELSKKNRIPLENKNINNIESISKLFDIIYDSETAVSKTQLRKQGKGKSKKLYEDEKYVIIQPESKEAACFYGKDTKWCISATQSDNAYDSYIKDGYKFLFIIDKLAAANKIAIAYKQEDSNEEYQAENIQVFDSDDDKIKPDKLHFTEGVTNFINSYLNTNIFHSFNPKEWIKKLPESLKNPEQFLAKANTVELLEALSYIADHGIVYNPSFTGLAEYFIEQILEKFNTSWLQDLQYKLYKIIRTEPSKANLNLNKNKVLKLLRRIISRRFTISGFSLVDPFIWAPGFVKNILDKSSNAKEFKINLLNGLKQGIIEGFYDNTIKAIEENPYIEHQLYELAIFFKKYNYNFDNMILNEK